MDVVNLNVSVSDGRDRHITGLAAGDFKILEDGVPQQVSLFTQERLPISLAILIDSSLSMQPNLPAVKSAALRLVRALRPEDQAEIVQFNHKFTVVQDFTSDQATAGGGGPRHHRRGCDRRVQRALLHPEGPALPGPDGELTRQAVVLLSDGEDTSSLVSDDQVLELAKRATSRSSRSACARRRTSTFDTEAPAARLLPDRARPGDGRPLVLPERAGPARRRVRQDRGRAAHAVRARLRLEQPRA